MKHATSGEQTTTLKSRENKSREKNRDIPDDKRRDPTEKVIKMPKIDVIASKAVNEKPEEEQDGSPQPKK